MKPVIISNLGGMTELIKNGERGILVPPKDSELWAEAMQWMIDHPGGAMQMGQKAREYAIREHGSERHYQRLMEVYKAFCRDK